MLEFRHKERENRMLHNISEMITRYAVARNWIAPTKASWCQYAIEKKFGFIFYLIMCLLTAAATHSWIRTFIYILVFYLLRQRFGGWHAKSFCSCQLISLGTVILIIMVIGPLLEQIKFLTTFLINLLLIICSFFLPPQYPSTANFDKAIISANFKRKNQLLILLFIFQCTTIKLWQITLIYSFLGLATTDLSVLLQYCLTQKKGC